VAEFLVELYIARGEEAEAARARSAVGRLTDGEQEVRVERALFLPDDETCFLLVDADSADAVRDAARRARLGFERLTEIAPTDAAFVATPGGGRS
jgi:hypothetical protein